jgi:broad specificity phosphatase PhoE
VEHLTLARHGESDFSARGLANGDGSVDVPLTPLGEQQARELGLALADEEIDLCVTSALGRTQATAAFALMGRGVAVEVWPGLNDPRVGRFESGPLEAYRAWAAASGSGEEPPGGGESRLAIVARYVGAYRQLLARPEAAILVVAHALPIAYVLSAADGQPPAARIERPVAYAHPYRLGARALRRALDVLEAWLDAPTW